MDGRCRDLSKRKESISAEIRVSASCSVHKEVMLTYAHTVHAQYNFHRINHYCKIDRKDEPFIVDTVRNFRLCNVHTNLHNRRTVFGKFVNIRQTCIQSSH